MTEISAGFYMAVAVVEIFMILATLVAFERKQTLLTIVIAQALAGLVMLFFFPVIVAGFGG